jgi:uncharacterized protein (TIGR01777 family)
MKKILVTGGTGFIGRHLCKSLIESGDQITLLSRQPLPKVQALLGPSVAVIASLEALNAASDFDAVINLAGEPIMGRRWSPAYQETLRQSRITLTEKLVDKIALFQKKPEVLISGSAIGIYGDQGDLLLDETSSTSGTGFSRTLCLDWESAARKAEALGVRVCIIRTGLVVGSAGGFLQRMLLPFKLGLGGPIASGRQWMSWIHLEDEVGLIRYLLDHTALKGTFNGTAPLPVTNAELTQTLARCLNRPAFFRVPAFVLNALFGEMGSLLLESQRVSPKRALEQGYTFQFTELTGALQSILKAPRS